MCARLRARLSLSVIVSDDVVKWCNLHDTLSTSEYITLTITDSQTTETLEIFQIIRNYPKFFQSFFRFQCKRRSDVNAPLWRGKICLVNNAKVGYACYLC